MGQLFAHVEAFDVQATRKEAKAEGIEEGRTSGVIDTVRQLGGTMEMAAQQLMTLCGLDESEAQEKVRLYW